MGDLKTLRTFYCSAIRSNLECSSAVWSPCSRTNIYNLEGPRRRATKFVLKAEDRYENRLEKLDLLSLKNRRVLTVVIFFLRY